MPDAARAVWFIYEKGRKRERELLLIRRRGKNILLVFGKMGKVLVPVFRNIFPIGIVMKHLTSFCIGIKKEKKCFIDFIGKYMGVRARYGRHAMAIVGTQVAAIPRKNFTGAETKALYVYIRIYK